METISEKPCFKCGTIQPLANFYKHPQMPDGHVNKCKECNKKDVQENYAKRREQYLAYDQKRQQTPERKQKQLEYQRRRRANKRERYIAHTAVGNAVRDGRLERLPCEVCGNAKSEGHHDDYSKPLDVRWLCFKHHREHHGQTVTVLA